MPEEHVPLAIVAALAALIPAVVAAILLARSADSRDLAERMRIVMRPSQALLPPSSVQGNLLVRMLATIGEVLQKRAVLSARDFADLERTVAYAGFPSRRAASVFLGAKAVMMLLCPVSAYLYTSTAGYTWTTQLLVVTGSVILGLFLPNWILGFLRRPFIAALRRGLPDALDLMVVCAEAGLGLETAVDRVAQEMMASNRALGTEFATLAQELRILSDRREALGRMGERTNMEGFQRLGSTLAQTLRYGTPLSQALRVLAAEMRNERMLRMEEKAARLPAMLVMPLILFIMPCLFIVLIGPSVLLMIDTLGSGK
jgi:tight adherence protein C